jgi:hypothetical protein
MVVVVGRGVPVSIPSGQHSDGNVEGGVRGRAHLWQCKVLMG